MGIQSEEKKKNKHLCIGLLAHVDAGKTTLSEGLLYQCGSIRKLGRVDHKDAFLDTYQLERERGITIFSKQAQLSYKDCSITLLDTPGHVDFSAEMERTLQVLDYAILVISGADGVQGHVLTLWKLLKKYRIPVFLFINKMDQPGIQKNALIQELKERLDERCLDFTLPVGEGSVQEALAMCDEALLDEYLNGGEIGNAAISSLIVERKVFPCYFGSALKMTGIEELLEGFYQYAEAPQYGKEFGARVYKISRDAQGTRLTHLKITGGSLRVKELLGEDEKEKADQLRIYSGERFVTVNEAAAGSIVAVTGLKQTYSGQGLGIEKIAELPVLEPVLTYSIELPPDCAVHTMYGKLRELEEEEPQLHIVWNEQAEELHAQVMGEVQIEILKNMIQERYGVLVEFGSGSIVYKETIKNTVEGVGHFEPLRHYAEVHLLMEPLEQGEGLQFEVKCSEDELAKNWQRLILTHLEEKRHLGVLTGSEITDMRITLVAGRAHLKHTEGGDFRQATYRAVRQGLMQAENVLLEPVYEFVLEIPQDSVGRAMTDIQRMQGSFDAPEIVEDKAIIRGSAPVSAMRGYQTQVLAYSRGQGNLSCTLKGYEPCYNAEEVISSIGYDCESDLENPTGSVFCSHGAGFVVAWDEIVNYMHIDSGLGLMKKQETLFDDEKPVTGVQRRAGEGLSQDKELEEIFKRTYGETKRERNAFTPAKEVRYQKEPVYKGPKPGDKKEEYLLVDGYNIIFAWDELKELAKVNLDSARGSLMDILCNYQGYKKNTVILVFDAYKVKGNPGSDTMYHNIHVIFTKEAETADSYIERVTHEIGKKHNVTVATSDALVQMITLGQGARRMSARGLQEEIEQINMEIGETLKNPKSFFRNSFDL